MVSVRNICVSGRGHLLFPVHGSLSWPPGDPDVGQQRWSWALSPLFYPHGVLILLCLSQITSREEAATITDSRGRGGGRVVVLRVLWGLLGVGRLRCSDPLCSTDCTGRIHAAPVGEPHWKPTGKAPPPPHNLFCVFSLVSSSIPQLASVTARWRFRRVVFRSNPSSFAVNVLTFPDPRNTSHKHNLLTLQSQFQLYWWQTLFHFTWFHTIVQSALCVLSSQMKCWGEGIAACKSALEWGRKVSLLGQLAKSMVWGYTAEVTQIRTLIKIARCTNTRPVSLFPFFCGQLKTLKLNKIMEREPWSDYSRRPSSEVPFFSRLFVAVSQPIAWPSSA